MILVVITIAYIVTRRSILVLQIKNSRLATDHLKELVHTYDLYFLLKLRAEMDQIVGSSIIYERLRVEYVEDFIKLIKGSVLYHSLMVYIFNGEEALKAYLSMLFDITYSKFYLELKITSNNE